MVVHTTQSHRKLIVKVKKPHGIVVVEVPANSSNIYQKLLKECEHAYRKLTEKLSEFRILHNVGKTFRNILNVSCLY